MSELQNRTWPHLFLLGNRALYTRGGESLRIDRPLTPPPAYTGRLEEAEALLAIRTDPEARRSLNQKLLWQDPDPVARQFLEFCYTRAVENGGIYLHPYLGQDLPLEALARAARDERPILVLRVRENEFIPGQPEEPEFATLPGGSERKIRALVYYNPLAEPALPMAETQALQIHAELAEVCEARYIARGLRAAELEENYLEADIIYYYGHGREVQGHPVIPAPGGWIPLLEQNYAPERYHSKILIFGACLDGAADRLGLPQFLAGVALYPVCRIADRNAGFLENMTRAWRQGNSLITAYRRALEADSDRSDIRRFIFNLQGENRMARQRNLFDTMTGLSQV